MTLSRETRQGKSQLGSVEKTTFRIINKSQHLASRDHKWAVDNGILQTQVEYRMMKYRYLN
jgi:hypothetical protein